MMKQGIIIFSSKLQKFVFCLIHMPILDFRYVTIHDSSVSRVIQMPGCFTTCKCALKEPASISKMHLMLLERVQVFKAIKLIG